MRYTTHLVADTLREPAGDDPRHAGGRSIPFEAPDDTAALAVVEALAAEYARDLENDHPGRSASVYTLGPLCERYARNTPGTDSTLVLIARDYTSPERARAFTWHDDPAPLIPQPGPCADCLVVRWSPACSPACRHH